MPNWCTNSLKISHSDSNAIERVRSAFHDKKLLSEFVPEPVQDGDGKLDWYFWRIENWGTKWDVGGDDFVIEDVPDSDHPTLQLYFDSAWAPPLKVYEVMTDLGYTIEATYYEPGVGFVGEWSSEHGNDHYEFEMTAESIADLPEHLVEEYGIEPYEDDDEYA